jgi:hypothetical protein
MYTCMGHVKGLEKLEFWSSPTNMRTGFPEIRRRN